MGLDCSHNAWHGSYGAFMRWRKKIAEVAGLPPLELMEGFYESIKNENGNLPTLYHGPGTRKPAFGDGSRPFMADIDDRLPIKWDCLKPSALHELLYHSDCDGEIASDRCGAIADALEKLVQLLPSDDVCRHRYMTVQFVRGLRAAAESGEPLYFR